MPSSPVQFLDEADRTTDNNNNINNNNNNDNRRNVSESTSVPNVRASGNVTSHGFHLNQHQQQLHATSNLNSINNDSNSDLLEPQQSQQRVLRITESSRFKKMVRVSALKSNNRTSDVDNDVTASFHVDQVARASRQIDERELDLMCSGFSNDVHRSGDGNNNNNNNVLPRKVELDSSCTTNSGEKVNDTQQYATCDNDDENDIKLIPWASMVQQEKFYSSKPVEDSFSGTEVADRRRRPPEISSDIECLKPPAVFVTVAGGDNHNDNQINNNHRHHFEQSAPETFHGGGMDEELDEAACLLQQQQQPPNTSSIIDQRLKSHSRLDENRQTMVITPIVSRSILDRFIKPVIGTLQEQQPSTKKMIITNTEINDQTPIRNAELQLQRQYPSTPPSSPAFAQYATSTIAAELYRSTAAMPSQVIKGISKNLFRLNDSNSSGAASASSPSSQSSRQQKERQHQSNTNTDGSVIGVPFRTLEKSVNNDSCASSGNFGAPQSRRQSQPTHGNKKWGMKNKSNNNNGKTITIVPTRARLLPIVDVITSTKNATKQNTDKTMMTSDNATTDLVFVGSNQIAGARAGDRAGKRRTSFLIDTDEVIHRVNPQNITSFLLTTLQQQQQQQQPQDHRRDNVSPSARIGAPNNVVVRPLLINLDRAAANLRGTVTTAATSNIATDLLPMTPLLHQTTTTQRREQQEAMNTFTERTGSSPRPVSPPLTPSSYLLRVKGFPTRLVGTTNSASPMGTAKTPTSIISQRVSPMKHVSSLFDTTRSEKVANDDSGQSDNYSKKKTPERVSTSLSSCQSDGSFVSFPSGLTNRLSNAHTRPLADPVLQNVVSKGSSSVLSAFLDASPSAFDGWSELFSSRRYAGTFKPVKKLGQGSFGAAFLVVYQHPSATAASPSASIHSASYRSGSAQSRASPTSGGAFLVSRPSSTRLLPTNQISPPPRFQASTSDPNDRSTSRSRDLAELRKALRERNIDITPNGGAVSAMGISEPIVRIPQKNNLGVITGTIFVPRQDLFVCKIEKIQQKQQQQPSEGDSKNEQAHHQRLVDEYAKQHAERSAHEAHILSNLAHPNIVGFVDFFVDKKKQEQLLFIEYVDAGDLFTELGRRRHSGTVLSEEEILHIFVQVVLAVEYCHRHNILHRDIKSQNVLLSKHGFVKLTDFGTARQFSTDVDAGVDTALKGTPLYLSPEICLGQPYSEKTDMWSLGVLLYEMLTTGCRYPFTAASIPELQKAIINSAFQNPNKFRNTTYGPVAGNRNNSSSRISQSIERLVCGLLNRDPSKRPTAMDVLNTYSCCQTALDRYVKRFNYILVQPQLKILDPNYRHHQQKHTATTATSTTTTEKPCAGDITLFEILRAHVDLVRGVDPTVRREDDVGGCGGDNIVDNTSFTSQARDQSIGFSQNLSFVSTGGAGGGSGASYAVDFVVNGTTLFPRVTLVGANRGSPAQSQITQGGGGLSQRGAVHHHHQQQQDINDISLLSNGASYFPNLLSGPHKKNNNKNHNKKNDDDDDTTSSTRSLNSQQSRRRYEARLSGASRLRGAASTSGGITAVSRHGVGGGGGEFTDANDASGGGN